jgi:sulfite reductase (NADPH) flavoprotein alpha-component
MSNPTIPVLTMDPELLRKLAQQSPLDQMWLSGYLYALAAQQPAQIHSNGAVQALAAPAAAEVPASAATKVAILYGSQTGNSKKVAKKLHERLVAAQHKAELYDLNDYPTKNLKSEQIALMVISTQGEGVPPVSAESFYTWLHGARAPRLEAMKFSVCALGDKSYLKFCQTGRDVDARFEALGATRIADRMDCDADYEDAAEVWIEAVLAALSSGGQVPAAASVGLQSAVKIGQAIEVHYDRKRQFEAQVLEKVRLDGRGSIKETWHVELSLEGSGIQYQPGDALGIIPQNPESLVREVLYAAMLDGNKTVEFEGERAALRDILRQKAEITTLNRDTLSHYAAWTGHKKLSAILEDNDQLRAFLWGRNLADLLREFPTALSEQTLVNFLRKLAPRLYSIASSELAHPDEVHLTVGAVRYRHQDRPHLGAASTFIADQLAVGSTVPVFVEQNEYFKLPDDSQDIIMVGPGTGIAPFRAFVEERTERAAAGRNWLFFGNPNFETDFLYQTEWLSYLKRGQLDRLDVAFSRDQAEKYYVQHRLQHRSKLIYDRLQDGAYFYVCGDKNRMAADVKTAITNIVAQESGKGQEFALDYVKSLQQQRRYLEDVY